MSDTTIRWDVAMSPERLAGFRSGVEAAIAIVEERGERIRGAIQPDRTVTEIRKRLLP